MNYLQKLIADKDRAYMKFCKNKSDYNRRNYIKNLVVLLEADVYRERMLLSQRLKDLLGEDQIVYAIHPDYIDFKNNGLPKRKTEDIPLTKCVKIIFKTYECLIDVKLNLFSDPGWEAFRKLKELRNRIIHPKIEEDLVISDAEIEYAKNAEDWYIKKFRILLARYSSFLEMHEGKLTPEAAKQFKEKFLS